MEIKEYSKVCSKDLLKEIYKLTKNKKIASLYQKYDANLNLDTHVDFSWSLISAALLFSENLWNNESVYKSISNESLLNIIDELNGSKLNIRGDQEIKANCLLDENNIVANPFSLKLIETILKDDLGTKVAPKELDVDSDEIEVCDRAYHEYYNSVVCAEKFGCNESIIEDDDIDCKKLIVRVRHALAHSNYEIIDDNFIRLYHYNSNTKKLDLNIALNKDIIVTILDELNENFHNLGVDFIRRWQLYRNRYIGTSHTLVDDEKLLELIMSFNILDKKNSLDVIKSAKEEVGYNECQIDLKLNVLLECILQKIAPICSFGIIVNEFLYGNDNSEIDEKYYEKFGFYQYLNSELFTLSMTSNNEKQMKCDKLKLLIFALLNSSLLNNINLKDNDITTPIDFAKMHIDKEYVDEINTHIAGYTQNINNKITKLRKDINVTTRKISNLMAQYHEHYEVDTDYYKNILPQGINDTIKQKSLLIEELNYFEELLPVASYSVLSNHILTHIRNSLAHGYVRINHDMNLDNFMDSTIEFIDYDPFDKSKVTFRGVIKLEDLLEIITDKRFINTLMLENNLNLVRNK